MIVRPFQRSRMAGALAAGRAVVVGILITGGVAGCTTSHPQSQTASSAAGAASSSQPPLGYRDAPSFLPTTAEPVDRVVTASLSHPQLAVQGVAVHVEIPSGAVLATVTGPHVPPFVTPPPPQVTATFDVSLTRAAGTVPVWLSDFSITDQFGRTFPPALVARETPPPSTVRPGRTVTFQVTAAMPTGEGRIAWSPGGKPIVTWDFIVEND